MLLETRVVSRKTPLDGRLEISEAAAARVAELGEGFAVAALGAESPGRLETLACTCGKRAGGHIHHFLASPPLKGLAEGSEVQLVLDRDRRTLAVLPTTTGTNR